MVRSPAPIEWHKPRAGSKLYAWNRGALFAKNMSSNYPRGTVQNGSIVSQNAADQSQVHHFFKNFDRAQKRPVGRGGNFFYFQRRVKANL
jgi:hypothetical protein